MGILGELLARFALTFLREWLARSDLQRAARLELVTETLRDFYARDQAALAVLVERAGTPDLVHRLRVRGDGPAGNVTTFTPAGSSPRPSPDTLPGP